MGIICKSCSARLPEQTFICPYCSGREFMTPEEYQTAVYCSQETQVLDASMNPQMSQYQQQYQQYQQYAQPQQYQQASQYAQQPAPQYGQYTQPQQSVSFQQPPAAPVKKKKKGTTAAIIVVILVVLAAIGSFAEDYFQKLGYGTENPSDSEQVSEENKTPYTKGEFNGSVYTNEWADIKITVPDGYTNADESVYAATINETTDCPIYIMATESGKAIFITYEKLPTFPVITQEMYIEQVFKVFETTEGITAVLPEAQTYETVSVGGYDYLSVSFTLNNGVADFTQNLFVRKLDNYMISICTFGTDADEDGNLVATKDLLAAISTVK